MCHIVNNHPAGMSMLGEFPKAGQLDFKGRDIPADCQDQEVINFFEGRIYYGDVAIGMTRFRSTYTQWARQRMGDEAVRIVQKIRNPILRFVGKRVAKQKPGAAWFQKLHGRSPKNEREIYEGVSAYFAQNYFEKFLKRSQHYPIVRLEDLNKSIGKDGVFFKRFMEWLTQTEWPWDYIYHIRDNWTPAYQYEISLEWDDEGRVSAVNMVRREKPTWRRDWSDGPEPPLSWERLAVEQPWLEEIYLKYHAGCQARLGYNQSGRGTTEADWEFRGAYPWGEV